MPNQKQYRRKAHQARTHRQGSDRKSVLRPCPKLRVCTVPKLGGKNWPGTSGILIRHLREKCEKDGLSWISLVVDRIPLSLNHHQDVKIRYKWSTDPRTGQRIKKPFAAHINKPEVEEFLMMVKSELNYSGQRWDPKGTTCALVIFQSPAWLTKAYMPRDMDADNKLKPACDAAQWATKVPDNLHWEYHVYKAVSKQERTLIYLFDLGEIVEYYLE